MIPTIDKEKTGKNLKKLMERKHITPMDMMEYLNLACVQTVYRWFEGINIPSVDNLYAISKLLKVGIDDLVVGEHDNKMIICRNEMLIRIKHYSNRMRRMLME